VGYRLTAFDDYPFHQGFTPFNVPVTSDTHYQDGYYFAWYRPGEHWFCGLRVHPNTNVMDGYAGVVHGGEQRSIRFSRALRPDYDTIEVGPFRLEIAEPMRRQHLTLAPNESGLTFEVDIVSPGFPFVESPHVHYRHGRLFNQVLRYSQASRASGWAAIGDARREVDWHACRDHSWGIRSTMGPHIPVRGIEQEEPDPRAVRLWIPFQVDDHYGFFHMHEDRHGTILDFEGRLEFPDREVRLATARHDFRYHEGTRRLSGGTFTLVDHAGIEYDYEFEVSCDPAHPQGFGYTRGWTDGGHLGVYRGEYAEEIDAFRVDDPSRSLGPHHVPEERRLGGTEFASTLRGPGGAEGMAHVEHMIYGAYEPSGFE
jgi:hypothetical protein